jgi:hypothetical protein
MPTKKAAPDQGKLDRIVAEAWRHKEAREQGYREQALKLYPWVCGRCGREFTHQNVRELTVHHKDHNHDYNPADGSNWELLCLYCHDEEHSRYMNAAAGGGTSSTGSREATTTYRPFANLNDLLKDKK